ncbi:hypothetical protein [Micrococcus luteus]|uniref:hypothetical protein n=1 Tax=Micrococcus luteus TaxID=1270 RepID=UPI003015F11D
MAKADADSSSPFGRAWLVSGALVLLALAMVAFLVWRGVTGEDKPADLPVASSPDTPAADVQEEETPVAAEGQCNPPRVKEKGLPAEAPEVQWERHPSGAILPVSEKHGPAVRDGEFWHCSSRSASGAIVAGISTAYNFVTGDLDSAVDTPSRDALFRKNQLPSDAEFGTVEGYRVILANGDEAVIEYLVSLDGKNAAMRVPLTWDQTHNDWLVNAGAQDMRMYADPNADDFTPWR